VIALKGALGHSGAASGLTELLASIQALQTGERPGTRNFTKTDLDINVQSGNARTTKPYAVKIAYTDLGQCAVAVIRSGTA
jgi:3-oxoacyl-[acyl-carrier-protein] synthase II